MDGSFAGRRLCDRFDSTNICFPRHQPSRSFPWSFQFPCCVSREKKKENDSNPVLILQMVASSTSIILIRFQRIFKNNHSFRKIKPRVIFFIILIILEIRFDSKTIIRFEKSEKKKLNQYRSSSKGNIAFVPKIKFSKLIKKFNFSHFFKFLRCQMFSNRVQNIRTLPLRLNTLCGFSRNNNRLTAPTWWNSCPPSTAR